MRRYAERHRDELRFLGPGDQAAKVMARLRDENERIERRRDLSVDEKRHAIAGNNARIRELGKRLVKCEDDALKARVPAGGGGRDERSGLLEAIRHGLR